VAIIALATVTSIFRIDYNPPQLDVEKSNQIRKSEKDPMFPAQIWPWRRKVIIDPAKWTQRNE
jgi:hypothetical protein